MPTAASNSPSTRRLLPLPPHIAGNQHAIQATATRLLDLAAVRSVVANEPGDTLSVGFKPRMAQPTEDALMACFPTAIAPPLAAAGDKREAVVSWLDPRDLSLAYVRMPPPATGWRKALYLTLAGAFLVLGAIGIVLPALPTTPFVILGSYFLLRSSESLHRQLIASRLFGGIVRDWHVHHGLRPHVRARAIAIVLLVVCLTLVLLQPSLPVLLVILTLVTCGLTVICRLPSIE